VRLHPREVDGHEALERESDARKQAEAKVGSLERQLKEALRACETAKAECARVAFAPPTSRPTFSHFRITSTAEPFFLPSYGILQPAYDGVLLLCHLIDDADAVKKRTLLG
jgi:hypothetical protein